MALAPSSSVPESMPDDNRIHQALDLDLGDPQDVQNIVIDPDTGVVTTHNEDGSAIVDFEPKTNREKPNNFDANLAVYMDPSALSDLGEEIIQGIDSDIESRSEWTSLYNKAIDLLGLKMEEASSDITTYGTVSKVYHPLLLEAVVRSQANARAELLPSNGPVKVRDDEPMGDQSRVLLAEALEKDFNHYLTSVAKEYYPDTDKMFFSAFLSGDGFKKVYHCPLRRRPVSDSVAPQDLIVSNDAVDLTSAIRITHRIYMNQSTMKRMQLSGQYRNIDLATPVDHNNENERKIKSIEGIQTGSKLPSDYRYTVYETYLDYDLPGFEHEEDGKPTGLPLPYRVTIDKDGHEILEIRRNYKQDDPDCRARRRFVKYPIIPGLGFYDYGYMHLLGNTTRALTAIERQLLDAGQFANFPGLLISRQGQRQVTNQIRIPPAGAHEIDTGGKAISDVVMPLPYKGPSATLAQIAQQIADDGRKLGGTTEIQAGEGRADVPVGTTIALIEQATKVISVVHKRLHGAQQEEFEIFKELFAEDPTALWKFAKNPARKWEQAQEFADLELVPAADPNVPSHIHRVMQATALIQLSQSAPQIYNLKEVHQRALNTLGIGDADALFAPPQASAPPTDPKVQAKAQDAQIKAMEQQREAQTAVLETQSRERETMAQLQDNEAERQNRIEVEALKIKQQEIKEQSANVKNTAPKRII